ncbi:ATP synthase f chain, mitochondrial precursor [Hypoxylon texense]
MATEPILTKPDAFLTDSALAQSAVTSNEIQDVSHSSATENSITSAEHRQIADVVNELVNSTEVSVSGSDTETSKADLPKHLGDKNHVRTSSTIKKPHSFKSVSVNRTFLAPKTATNSTSRPDSSPGTTSSTPQPIHSNPASRLKLVAKSGSSLGGSTKTLSSNGKPAAAPDPNTVWNRNRPISQPEQKKLSDEELMQKFGIHMAGRLGPEDAKGQSNWADIEDDDEWAPETITWTDGTKITLPQADEAPPTPSMAPATIHKEPAPVPPKSKSPAPIASAIGSPSVKPSNIASGKSLVLKGAPEKPTLVAKPPALPTPAKSPWARLPPIERVPPGQIDGPAAASASRLPAREHIPGTSATPPPTTKEIAADDFSRSGFQDGHLNNHSQLFNSHSGRYEPVSDRRGSRNDIYGRQPAVLQRPQHHDQQGPAEPSAAFQTSRMSGQDAAPYGRRRGSSNVSGTSGSLAHKLGRPHDMPPPPLESLQSQSGSVITGGAESPVSSRTFSPANNQPTPRLQHNQPYQPRPSPGQTNAASVSSPTVDVPPEEDVIAVQKRVMHERREQARKRRLEEEAREEEARRARIAEKLKALGPAPERKSSAKEDRKDDVPAPPTHTQQTNIPASSATESGAAVKAPVEPSKLTTPATPAAGDVKSASNKQVNGEASRPLEQASKSRNEMGHLANVPKPQSTTTPWPDAPAPPWTQTPARGVNVWAPDNNRSLGNGTFTPDLITLPDSHPSPITERSHRPAPIGPPRSASQQPGRPESMSSGRLAPIGPPRGRHSNMSQTPEQSANSWQSFATNARDDDRRRALEMQEKMDAQVNQPSLQMKETWRAPDGTIREVTRVEAGAISRTVSNQNESRSSFNPSAQEIAELAKRAKGLMPTDFAARDAARAAIIREANGIQPAINHSGSIAPGHPAQPRSSSRFFPSNTAHLRDTPSRDSRAQEDARTKSPTPPPPTADGHPVFDGDVTRPHVALPPARPIVKLPPSNNPSPVVPSAKPAPISFAAAAAAVPVRANAQPGTTRPSSRGVGYNGIAQKPHEIASQENWQDKINSLMGKKPAPAPPIRSVAVDSSSKIALDHSQFLDLATVALPVPGLSHSVSSLDSEDGDFTSKEMAEECFGEQEMGSLPAVRLPSETPDALWQAVEPDFDPAPVRMRIDATGAEAYRFMPEMSSGRVVVRVSNPLMFEAKTVLMPFANHRSSSNPRRQGTRGGPRRLSGRAGQRGGRDHNDHVGDHASSSPGRPPSTRSGGRGGYRPRTEHWGRHASAAPAAQS